MSFSWLPTSIANRIILLVLCLELLSISIWGGLTYSASKQELLHGMDNQLRESALRTRTEVSAFFTPIDVHMRVSAEILSGLELPAHRQRNVLEYMMNVRQELEEVSLIDSNRMETVRLSRMESYGPDDLRDLSGDTLVAAVSDTNTRPSEILFSRFFEPQLRLAVTVPTETQSQNRALSAVVNLKWLTDIVQVTRVGKTGYVYVVTEDLDLIGHIDPSKVLARLNLSRMGVPKALFATPEPSGFQRYQNFDGVPVAGAAAFDAHNRWWVVVELPEAEGFAGLARVVQRFIVVFLAAALLTVAIVLYFSRRTTRPLRDFEHAIERIAAGERKVRLDVAKNSELAPMGNAFNAMACSLDETIEALKRGEARLRAITETVQAGILLASPSDGRMIFVNDYVGRAVGISSKDMVGQKTGDYYAYPEERAAVMAAVREYGEVRDRELQLRRADGSLAWILMSITTLPLEEESLLLTTFVDITERRRAQDEVRAARDELEDRVAARTQELKDAVVRAEAASGTKTQFLANMSHELRTPLNAIIGFSETMLHELFGPLGSERYKEYVTNINESGHHLLDLISDILDVSSIESDKLKLYEEKIDPAEVAAAALRQVHTLADAKGMQLECTVVLDNALYADERRVRQVLINLLSNAIKFTAPGGKITVGGEVLSSGSLVLSVTDTGIGMSAEDITKSLKPFGQAEAGFELSKDGTGLGLYLCRNLMQAHGGDITVDSRVGEGTSVWAVFPPERVFRSMS